MRKRIPRIYWNVHWMKNRKKMMSLKKVPGVKCAESQALCKSMFTVLSQS